MTIHDTGPSLIGEVHGPPDGSGHPTTCHQSTVAPPRVVRPQASHHLEGAEAFRRSRPMRASLLRHADAAERQVFYREFGLHLAYERVGDHEKLRAHLGWSFRVSEHRLATLLHAPSWWKFPGRSFIAQLDRASLTPTAAIRPVRAHAPRAASLVRPAPRRGARLRPGRTRAYDGSHEHA